MGVAFEVRPFPGFLWASDVLVDDISANELLRLDFDTKIKIAAVSGVQYAFNTSVVKLLKTLNVFAVEKLSYALIGTFDDESKYVFSSYNSST